MSWVLIISILVLNGPAIIKVPVENQKLCEIAARRVALQLTSSWNRAKQGGHPLMSQTGPEIATTCIRVRENTK